MGAGNFFAGLLGGYTGTVVRNESRAYNQEMQARELDVNASLKALDEAVKTGDQGAMQAAAANFQRSVNAIREPFHTGLGGGKGKGKKQGQQDPLVSSILQGMIQHGTSQRQPGGPSALPAVPTIPGQGAKPGYDPGMTFGKPSESPTGSIPAPQAQSQAPQTGNQPTEPQQGLPALPTLASVFSKFPDLQTQAASSGQAQAAESGARFNALKAQRESELGRPLKPEESDQLWESVSGVLPKNVSTKPTLVTPKAPVTAGEAASSSPNAVLADGRPLSAIDPKQPVNLWQYPDGRVLAFPASSQPAASGTISGQEAQAVQELVGKPNPDTGKAYTRVEAISKVRHAMASNAAGGKAIPTKTLIVGGKPHVMGWDGGTQKYDIDMGVAPSSTGYPRVVNINDDKGNTTGAYVMRALPSGGIAVSQVNFERPIPPKPTAAVLTQGQRSAMIQPQVQATIDLVHQTAGKLGWASGRWNDAVTKFGANNPDIAALQMKLQLFATALMLAHGLRGENYEKTLSTYLNAAQSPDNLVARIQSADDFLTDYAGAVGRGKTPPVPSRSSGKGAPSGSGPKPKTADEYLKSIGAR